MVSCALAREPVLSRSIRDIRDSIAIVDFGSCEAEAPDPWLRAIWFPLRIAYDRCIMVPHLATFPHALSMAGHASIVIWTSGAWTLAQVATFRSARLARWYWRADVLPTSVCQTATRILCNIFLEMAHDRLALIASIAFFVTAITRQDAKDVVPLFAMLRDCRSRWIVHGKCASVHGKCAIGLTQPLRRILSRC